MNTQDWSPLGHRSSASSGLLGHPPDPQQHPRSASQLNGTAFLARIRMSPPGGGSEELHSNGSKSAGSAHASAQRLSEQPQLTELAGGEQEWLLGFRTRDQKVTAVSSA